MDKWEYMKDYAKDSEIIEKLNKWGNEGWELVGISPIRMQPNEPLTVAKPALGADMFLVMIKRHKQ